MSFGDMQIEMKAKAILLLLIAVTFSMYKETPAQKKRPKKESTEASVIKTPPTIAYTVGMSKPATHMLEVEMRVSSGQLPASLELKMPVWTPGSYLIREYARHVQDFAVKD